ncbi:response regulator transcription factor [Opitutus terrae]|uniref:Two component transcriptional regulator, winged helix family n=1 Tax=Opitutus terrae (strain DSM 11246 / JCM 15787 / PB90-1) TaxID=452637 RepID=B1ZPF8_OPITP|nr:response regulator transcription factor [Opitutus terrae]ACB74477.1 two component transcriptional regulator, winged helix family [Opitutus terrae PB90-1]
MGKSRRHLLFLEDNRDIHLAFLALFERVFGYAVHPVGSIKEASGLLGRQNIDAAVIDLAYGPELSARLAMLRSWRTCGEGFPVITTSAHDYDGLCIEALAAGADDFLRKPFRFSELAARIERQLSRGHDLSARQPKLDGMHLPPAAFEFAGAVIHPDMRATFPDGTALQLSAKQVGILQGFARHAGALVLRNDLIHAVWGADANTNSKSLDQYLYVLRRMYRAAGIDLSPYVTPVLRVGWRISADAAAAAEYVVPR